VISKPGGVEDSLHRVVGCGSRGVRASIEPHGGAAEDSVGQPVLAHGGVRGDSPVEGRFA
jgi:hypothetical protein